MKNENVNPKDEQKFDIYWRRMQYPEHGLLTCRGLTYKQVVRRMVGAIKNSGPVIVERLERSEERE